MAQLVEGKGRKDADLPGYLSIQDTSMGSLAIGYSWTSAALIPQLQTCRQRIYCDWLHQHRLRGWVALVSAFERWCSV